jgi:hypothetical protein
MLTKCPAEAEQVGSSKDTRPSVAAPITILRRNLMLHRYTVSWDERPVTGPVTDSTTTLDVVEMFCA